MHSTRICRFAIYAKDQRLEFIRKPMDRYWMRQLRTLTIH